MVDVESEHPYALRLLPASGKEVNQVLRSGCVCIQDVEINKQCSHQGLSCGGQLLRAVVRVYNKPGESARAMQKAFAASAEQFVGETYHMEKSCECSSHWCHKIVWVRPCAAHCHELISPTRVGSYAYATTEICKALAMPPRWASYYRTSVPSSRRALV